MGKGWVMPLASRASQISGSTPKSAKVLRLRSVWSPSSVMSGVASSRTGAWAPAVSMIPDVPAVVPAAASALSMVVWSSVELWSGSTASAPCCSLLTRFLVF